MTRLERIKNMSAEEMAKLLSTVIQCYDKITCRGCSLHDAQNCEYEGLYNFLLEEDDGTWI